MERRCSKRGIRLRGPDSCSPLETSPGSRELAEESEAVAVWLGAGGIVTAARALLLEIDAHQPKRP